MNRGIKDWKMQNIHGPGCNEHDQHIHPLHFMGENKYQH